MRLFGVKITAAGGEGFFFECVQTLKTCVSLTLQRGPLSLDVSALLSIHFPLTGARACTSKCNKNPDRKKKKDITKCCPTVYLFQCNTRDQEIISAHTTHDSESLDDHEILLYSSINVKIAKICFTRFFKELCLRLLIFFINI